MAASPPLPVEPTLALARVDDAGRDGHALVTCARHLVGDAVRVEGGGDDALCRRDRIIFANPAGIRRMQRFLTLCESGEIRPDALASMLCTTGYASARHEIAACEEHLTLQARHAQEVSAIRSGRACDDVADAFGLAQGSRAMNTLQQLAVHRLLQAPGGSGGRAALDDPGLPMLARIHGLSAAVPAHQCLQWAAVSGPMQRQIAAGEEAAVLARRWGITDGSAAQRALAAKCAWQARNAARLRLRPAAIEIPLEKTAAARFLQQQLRLVTAWDMAARMIRFWQRCAEEPAVPDHILLDVLPETPLIPLIEICTALIAHHRAACQALRAGEAFAQVADGNGLAADSAGYSALQQYALHLDLARRDRGAADGAARFDGAVERHALQPGQAAHHLLQQHAVGEAMCSTAGGATDFAALVRRYGLHSSSAPRRVLAWYCARSDVVSGRMTFEEAQAHYELPQVMTWESLRSRLHDVRAGDR